MTIEEMIKNLEARKVALPEAIRSAKTTEEVDAFAAEGKMIDAQLLALREAVNTQPATDPQFRGEPHGTDPAQRSAPTGGINPLATYGVPNQAIPAARTAEPEDKYSTLEYRTAFMKFAKTGEITPELRADAMTTTTDVSAVIPSTILNEVIRKVTEYGQIFNRVRKLNIKGGVTVPILSLKPTATWIGEAATSDKKKVTANTNISFSYYGLECKVSTSLLSDTVTLTGFETTITDLIVEAMVQGMDLAIISGDGNGKALGITVDPRVPAAQVVTIASGDFTAWDAWKKKIFAKMPLKYKAGAAFIMASGTFEGYVDGMVDANGQPIGRINYGITDGAQERFGGKEVILVEDDVVANYDDAAVGAVVAVYCNLKNYGLNTNMQMTMYRYLDHDTNEWIDKAIMIVDGKLIDPNGVVIIKKGA